LHISISLIGPVFCGNTSLIVCFVQHTKTDKTTVLAAAGMLIVVTSLAAFYRMRIARMKHELSTQQHGITSTNDSTMHEIEDDMRHNYTAIEAPFVTPNTTLQHENTQPLVQTRMHLFQTRVDEVCTSSSACVMATNFALSSINTDRRYYSADSNRVDADVVAQELIQEPVASEIVRKETRLQVREKIQRQLRWTSCATDTILLVSAITEEVRVTQEDKEADSVKANIKSLETALATHEATVSCLEEDEEESITISALASALAAHEATFPGLEEEEGEAAKEPTEMMDEDNASAMDMGADTDTESRQETPHFSLFNVRRNAVSPELFKLSGINHG